PVSGGGRDVLSALVRAADAAGVHLLAGRRVLDVARSDGAFGIATASGTIRSGYVVLATGGQSLPRSGSDGAGFEFARRLGHTIVPTTPALVPLVLDGHLSRSGARRLDRRPHLDAAVGIAAVDALRNQRASRAERVAPLAAREERGTLGSADGELLSGRQLRNPREVVGSHDSGAAQGLS